ncbi:MMPL family transporter, partial [Pseudoalteromonas ostreae]
LVAGFLIMALSTYRVNADMGVMTAITIVIALLVDFLLLPSLLIAADKIRKDPQPVEENSGIVTQN